MMVGKGGGRGVFFFWGMPRELHLLDGVECSTLFEEEMFFGRS